MEIPLYRGHPRYRVCLRNGDTKDLLIVDAKCLGASGLVYQLLQRILKRKVERSRRGFAGPITRKTPAGYGLV